MNRRSALTGAVLFLAGSIAGCSFDGPSTPECHLMHEIATPAEDYGETTETYRYDELSGEAQQVFEETVANGSFATTDRDLDSPEFRYWDTTTAYTITYKSETYTLLTYTGEGCETSSSPQKRSSKSP